MSASCQGEAALALPRVSGVPVKPSPHLAGFIPPPWSLRESPPGKDGIASARLPSSARAARPPLSVEGPCGWGTGDGSATRACPKSGSAHVQRGSRCSCPASAAGDPVSGVWLLWDGGFEGFA